MLDYKLCAVDINSYQHYKRGVYEGWKWFANSRSWKEAVKRGEKNKHYIRFSEYTNMPVGVALAERTVSFARQAPLRLARRLYSVNCFIFNPDALVSNKQTLYHISAAQISLNTISNGHLTFMKMTEDGSPPESSSYDGWECDRGKKGNHRRESTEWEG